MFLDKHRSTRALLSSYIDGELRESEVKKLEVHLAICPSCRTELKGLQTTVNLLNSVISKDPAINFMVHATQKSHPRSSTPLWQPIPVPVIVSILITLSLFLGDFFHYLPLSGNGIPGPVMHSPEFAVGVGSEKEGEAGATQNISNSGLYIVSATSSPVVDKAEIDAPPAAGAGVRVMAEQVASGPQRRESNDVSPRTSLVGASGFSTPTGVNTPSVSAEKGMGSVPQSNPAVETPVKTLPDIADAEKLEYQEFSVLAATPAIELPVELESRIQKPESGNSSLESLVIPWRLLEFLSVIISGFIIMNTVLKRRRLQ